MPGEKLQPGKIICYAKPFCTFTLIKGGMMKKIMLVILVLVCFALVFGNSLKINNFDTKTYEPKGTFGLGISGEDETIVKKFFRKYANPAGKILNVFNKKGNIKVIGWDRDYAVVAATMITTNNTAETPVFDVSNNGEFTVKSNCSGCWKINYVLRVPKSMIKGIIDTKAGKVTIKNLPKVK